MGCLCDIYNCYDCPNGGPDGKCHGSENEPRRHLIPGRVKSYHNLKSAEEKINEVKGLYNIKINITKDMLERLAYLLLDASKIIIKDGQMIVEDRAEEVTKTFLENELKKKLKMKK